MNFPSLSGGEIKLPIRKGLDEDLLLKNSSSNSKLSPRIKPGKLHPSMGLQSREQRQENKVKSDSKLRLYELGGSGGRLLFSSIILLLLIILMDCSDATVVKQIISDPFVKDIQRSREEPIKIPASLVKRPERNEPETMPCGTIKSLESNEEVYIESPNFSEKMNYPNSLSCEWKFMFTGRRAKLSCPNFHLTEFLCFDHMEVDGANGISNRYCGSSGPHELIISEETRITFRSSAYFGNVGFRCTLLGIDDDIEESPQPTAAPTQCFCGIGNNSTRIVNGVEAEYGVFPWQTGLVRVNGTRPFCGGSLINDRYILTAAHCVSGRTPHNLEVLLNLHNLEVGSELLQPIRMAVDSIITHRKYTSRLDYDAALIRMKGRIDVTKISPVCLPLVEDFNNPFIGINATVTGWGLTMEDGDLSSTLRRASVVTLNNEDCAAKYSSITDRMICAAAPGTDACQGDSGGPLFFESDMTKNKHTQIGVVSWGIGCARPNKPGVYTRITSIMNWIFKTAADGSYCDETFPKFIGSIK